jgi:G3E family GTPase
MLRSNDDGTIANENRCHILTSMTVTLTVLAGFDRAARDRVARSLLARSTGAAWICHDLSGLSEGVVHRRVTAGDGTPVESEVVELAHGCVACTVRLDVLPTILRLAGSGRWRRLLLELPSAIEPLSLVEAVYGVPVDPAAGDNRSGGGDGELAVVADHVTVDAVVTAVVSSRLLPELALAESLAERGLAAAAEDDRCVGEVIARQVEAADVIAPVEEATPDEWELLRRLNPTAAVVPADRVADAWAARCAPGRPYDLAALRTRTDPAWVPAAGQPVAAPDVAVLRWRSRRPMHPGRLCAGFERVVAGTMRGRGRLWLATRPDRLLAWESTGPRLHITDCGPWLAADPDGWADADAQDRLRADLDWDPYFGDRVCELAFTGIGLDQARLRDALDGCVLTDAELADGEAGWRALPDPFRASGGHADPVAEEPSG